MLEITTILAVLIFVVYISLTFHIIGLRWKYKISLSDGGNKQLQYAIRAQGNLVEYSIFFLFLLLLAELNGFFWFVLLGIALLFALGRGLHLYGFISQKDGLYRTWGMRFTIVSLLILAPVSLLALII